MASFEIIGGKKLEGEINPQGAKNSALQILCAVLLTDQKVIINNIPEIRDVNKLIELLESLGVVTERIGESTIIFAQHFKKVIAIYPFVNYYDPNDICVKWYADFEDSVYNKFLETVLINIAIMSTLSLRVVIHKK